MHLIVTYSMLSSKTKASQRHLTNQLRSLFLTKIKILAYYSAPSKLLISHLFSRLTRVNLLCGEKKEGLENFILVSLCSNRRHFMRTWLRCTYPCFKKPNKLKQKNRISMINSLTTFIDQFSSSFRKNTRKCLKLFIINLESELYGKS